MSVLKKLFCVAFAVVLTAMTVPAVHASAETTEADDAAVQAVIQYIASLDPAAPQCHITYDFGNGQTYTIGPEMAMSMMKTNDDGSFYIDPETSYYVLDRDKMIGFFTSMSQIFSITSTTLDFTTQSGKTITFKNTSNTARVIDTDAEVAYLSEAIMSGKNETREPELTLSSEYVEVDLAAQKAYLVDDGEVVWSSNIVSGNVSEGNGTPEGVYAINKYMTTDTVLIGVDDSYESPVSYWMPFIGNSVGLHDASWRYYFGGTIYKTNGSHGCVNLPTSKAKALYSLVHVGTPVVVHS